jgi:hypothetical protein
MHFCMMNSFLYMCNIVYLSSGLDGLCETASRRDINFNEDMQSSCLLWLSQDEINDCENLK